MTNLRHLGYFVALALFWGISPNQYSYWGKAGVPVSHILVFTGFGRAGRVNLGVYSGGGRYNRVANLIVALSQSFRRQNHGFSRQFRQQKAPNACQKTAKRHNKFNISRYRRNCFT